MNPMAEAIDQEMAALTRMRDELRLQIHLAQADARTMFDRLEARWPEVETQAEKLRDASTAGGHEVAEAVRAIVNELRAGYGEVKRRLTS